MIVSYADDAPHCLYSIPKYETYVTPSLNRNLRKTSVLNSVLIMRLIPTKMQNMIVSRSRTFFFFF